MSEGETNRSPPRQGFQTAVNHMLERKIDSLLWLTRLGTIVFTVFSMIPLFGTNPYTNYQRALMSSAATSALRLHQRMPRIQFTREFGAMLLMEDSCHYLLYSILFIISYPITLSLLPVFLFALLHSVTYSAGLLYKLGCAGQAASLSAIAEHHQQNILKLVSFTEICLMPITVIWLFSGKGSLLTPFAYYRFLTFRYASRRNPYTRTVFHEMRIVLEAFANTPGRSISLKNMCYKVINYASYLAPPIPTQQ
ncbi:transmembrane protein 33 [Trichonephila clavata]|uniref:Transmembrane protein 33 n=1 Tax=Trichonephila clavata TaxID=2740835 RepID=A0A8X6IRT6_TRICU|nr:transmembrane protein 33 [Trichonephila clavata]